MRQKKKILVCDVCLNRNYSYSFNQNSQFQRLICKKFCPICRKHTVHKQTL